MHKMAVLMLASNAILRKMYDTQKHRLWCILALKRNKNYSDVPDNQLSKFHLS